MERLLNVSLGARPVNTSLGDSYLWPKALQTFSQDLALSISKWSQYWRREEKRGRGGDRLPLGPFPSPYVIHSGLTPLSSPRLGYSPGPATVYMQGRRRSTPHTPSLGPALSRTQFCSRHCPLCRNLRSERWRWKPDSYGKGQYLRAAGEFYFPFPFPFQWCRETKLSGWV